MEIMVRLTVVFLAALLLMASTEPIAAQVPEIPTDCTEVSSAANIFIGHDCGEWASILISGRIIIRKPWTRANRANRGVRLRERREGGGSTTRVPSDPGVAPERTREPSAQSPTMLFGIDVSGGDKPDELDCGDFQYREDAEELFAAQGWSAENDPYGLDGATIVDDGDPCESNPSRP